MSGDSSKWRMDAYYYGFDATGVPAIDRILSAVACAGKGYHHTEGWTEPGSGGYEHLRGDTYAEMIQNAASDAAAELIARAEKAEAEVERLKGEKEELRKATIRVMASLAGAISLLERGGKAAKKAAPSDNMFALMLDDYSRALDAVRDLLNALEAKP